MRERERGRRKVRSFNVEAGRKNQKGEERYRERANGRKGFLVGPVVAVWCTTRTS